MKEAEIRSRTAHNTYLALVSADAERLAQDHSAFAAIDCPCCGGRSIIEEFQKAGFRYVSCESCATLFVNPRPTFDSLMALYADSPSTRYWVEEFFKPMAEARRRAWERFGVELKHEVRFLGPLELPPLER